MIMHVIMDVIIYIYTHQGQIQTHLYIQLYRLKRE